MADMDAARLQNLNPAALAYIGDAVYELAVRERILEQGISRADKMHKRATGYVCAYAQAAVIRTVFNELTEREQALVKRCRNYKYHSKAKNADPMTYKWATAFESLVGYLYLSGDEQRQAWLHERAFEIVETM